MAQGKLLYTRSWAHSLRKTSQFESTILYIHTFLTVTIHPGDKKKYIIKTDEHSLAWTAIVSIFRGGTADESLNDARRS